MALLITCLALSLFVFLAGGDLLGVRWVAVGFAEPVAVFDVMTGVCLVKGLCLFRINLFNELGRNASPEFAIAYLSTGENESACGYNSSTSHYGVVEHRRTHTHECPVLYLTTMQGDGVPDGDVIAQDAWGFAVEGVDAGVVLNVGAVTYLNIMNITTNDGVEPNGAVVAHFDVTYDDGAFREIAMLTKAWARHAVEFLYYGHNLINLQVYKLTS